MALGVLQWIPSDVIVVITIGVIFGLIWGSLFEERFYRSRSKKKKKHVLRKILKWQKGIPMMT